MTPRTRKPAPAPFKGDWRARNQPLKWNDTEALIIHYRTKSIPAEEQEMHLYDNRQEHTIQIDSSNQLWLTKLKACPLFIVKNIHLAPNGLILTAAGSLPKGAISLRNIMKDGTDGTANDDLV